ncbi:aminodeoxychorismate synthase component I [Rhizorhabdus dicambivorans]|uniref:Aminodeoxychorismate synthase, component I n=1 Tax=Rhizorhabdus dicambivorans TaxID=1850238 RepID=A0A2A4FYG3_9SPHN|nr:aminodeoxychorismate synthase component I [Rhizorhabdus dicambivorans]ATE63621.1 aminodeoxychorismate synthase, component I [Rhizorhabdus dicambivorans]PCE42747.1 aminodeoxychorismate synthase, component I [Rhizorhabdus dicambivorans]
MPAVSRPSPFILLEDIEKGEASLYERPRDMITATSAEDVHKALARADAVARAGGIVAGWIGYEAGYALEPRLRHWLGGNQPGDALLRLFAFDGCTAMPAETVDGWLGRRAIGLARLSPLRPAIGFDSYAASFGRVKEAIAAGDIYQANLTFRLEGGWEGDPVALYRAIRPAANARFAALIFDGVEWLLSFSPELFFAMRDRNIAVRPMKGTRPRGSDAPSDRRLAEALAASVKDRAENLMIVDLMRNDLARMSLPGSVRVDSPFRIETYPTLFQMTTGISARIDGPPSFERAIRAMFPCGSITGAPKLRAMEIIREIEHRGRGPYCGAIGAIHGATGADEAWQCRFNVAIRTLRLRPGGQAEYGVGSGIVADSVLEEEWAECLLKSAFIDRAVRPPW